jgi:hypothetical protein
MTETCPWCSAPRGTGDDCPRCGANYAKAAAIRAHGRATSATPAAAPATPDEAATGDATLVCLHEAPEEWKEVSDAELELKFCIAAIPAALLFAMAFHASGFGAALQRIFLTMPVHEFGHALTAWFCGYTAIPTLWKTLVPETRGFIAPVLLAGAIGYMMYQARESDKPVWLYAGAALLVPQVACTFVISAKNANMLITFGGDGMGMIIAIVLMASFFFGKRTQLYKGSLRWGFVVIGAASFVDIYATWWKSRKDDNAIPYGTTGGMATDAMKLVDDHGWTLPLLVHRYVVLGVCCLITLACIYAWGVWRAKTELEARRAAEKKAAWEAGRPGR